MSIVFDRATKFYDQTRAMPPGVIEAALETLARETGITRESSVLEIGVGSGRIALPMLDYAPRLVGVDLSLGMMGLLQEKLEQAGGSLPLAQADVLRLPFAANTFSLIYAVHVLHLVQGWQGAIADAWRVLKPGGGFAVNFHRRPKGAPDSELRMKLTELVAARGIDNHRPGAHTEEEIQETLTEWDPQVRAVRVTDYLERESPAELLDGIDRQIHSNTWLIPREVLDEVLPALREWAIKRYGDLEQPVEVYSTFRWLIAQKA